MLNDDELYMLKSNKIMLCYVMLCYVMLCYVMLCYVMLCYVMLCYCRFNNIHVLVYNQYGVSSCQSTGPVKLGLRHEQLITSLLHHKTVYMHSQPLISRTLKSQIILL